MEIRKATQNDTEELAAFFIRMNEIINTRTDSYDPDNEVYPSREMMTHAIDTGGQIVGIEDGIIVMAAIVNNECPDVYNRANWQIKASSDEVWILHAFRIAPEYEGRGFAKQTLDYIIKLAAESGIKAIRIDVFDGYNVERMYYKFGFKYIDTVEILYEDIGYPTKFRLLERVIDAGSNANMPKASDAHWME